MIRYQHTQVGKLNLFALGLAGSWTLAAGLFLGLPRPFDLFTIGLGGLFLILGLLFFSLRIQVDGEGIRIAFGPGIISRSWALGDCVSARQVRTSLIDGWGVKLTRDGWLYSVARPHAVRIRLTNGACVLLGTDEPEVLLAALLEAGLDLEQEPR